MYLYLYCPNSVFIWSLFFIIYNKKYNIYVIMFINRIGNRLNTAIVLYIIVLIGASILLMTRNNNTIATSCNTITRA